MQRLQPIVRKPTPRSLIIAGIIIVVALAGGITLYASRPASTAKQQMQTLVKQVGKLIVLPQNEQPAVATVTDAATARKQPFFAQAQAGDKVLLYTNHHMAYLYRPSAHKLINVGPINGVVSYVQFSLTVRNGTADTALTDDAAGKVNSSFPNAKIAEKTSAHRSTYPSTIVIPLNQKFNTLAAQVAQVLGGQVGVLPTGESQPGSDLLIIIGQDYKE